MTGPVRPDTHPLQPAGRSAAPIRQPGLGLAELPSVSITDVPGGGMGASGTSDTEAGSPRSLPQRALPRHTKVNVPAAACTVEKEQAKALQRDVSVSPTEPRCYHFHLVINMKT